MEFWTSSILFWFTSTMFMALVSKTTIWPVICTFLEKMTGKKGNCFCCCMIARFFFLSYRSLPFSNQTKLNRGDIFPQNKGCIWIIPWFWSMHRNVGPSCALFFAMLTYFETGLQVLSTKSITICNRKNFKNGKNNNLIIKNIFFPFCLVVKKGRRKWLRFNALGLNGIFFPFCL